MCCCTRWFTRFSCDGSPVMGHHCAPVFSWTSYSRIQQATQDLVDRKQLFIDASTLLVRGVPPSCRRLPARACWESEGCMYSCQHWCRLANWDCLCASALESAGAAVIRAAAPLVLKHKVLNTPVPGSGARGTKAADAVEPSSAKRGNTGYTVQ